MACPDCQRIPQVGRKFRRLKKDMLKVHIAADEFFVELCNPNRAEQAMSELWGSGELNCEPQDYAAIVAHCLEAIRFYRASRTKPV